MNRTKTRIAIIAGIVLLSGSVSVFAAQLSTEARSAIPHDVRPMACPSSFETGIVEQTYYRWRKEYGGLQVDQAKRFKELEAENAKLKRLVANLCLEKLVLKDIAEGNF
jgi:Transposase